MNARIINKISIVAAACVLITACVSAEITCTATVKTKTVIQSTAQGSLTVASNNDSTTGLVTIYGSMQASGLTGMIAAATNNIQLADAASITIDISQSSVTWPQKGYATLTIIDKRNGNTISSHSFQWTKNGKTLIFSNPSEVNSWLTSSGASIENSRLDYNLENINVQGAPGDNIVSATIYQNGIVKARSLTQWNVENWHDCGRGRICSPR